MTEQDPYSSVPSVFHFTLRAPRFTPHVSRLRHLHLALRYLPGLLLKRRHRALLRDALAFCQTLPAALDQPLPAALQQIDNSPPSLSLTPEDETTARALADLAALLDRRSPLGICLRRSLVRYRFLRAANIPVTIHLGARLTGVPTQRQVAGHAWLTHNGRPYHEADENWQGFTIMLSWPEQ